MFDNIGRILENTNTRCSKTISIHNMEVERLFLNTISNDEVKKYKELKLICSKMEAIKLLGFSNEYERILKSRDYYNPNSEIIEEIEAVKFDREKRLSSKRRGVFYQLDTSIGKIRFTDLNKFYCVGVSEYGKLSLCHEQSARFAKSKCVNTLTLFVKNKIYSDACYLHSVNIDKNFVVDTTMNFVFPKDDYFNIFVDRKYPVEEVNYKDIPDSFRMDRTEDSLYFLAYNYGINNKSLLKKMIKSD